MSQQLIRDGKGPNDWGALPNLVRGWFQKFNEQNLVKNQLSTSMTAWCALADKLRVAFNRAENEVICADFEAREAARPPDREWSLSDMLRSLDDRRPTGTKAES